MRLRDLLILSGLLVLGATVGIVVLSSDSHADERPPTAPTDAAPTAPTVAATLPADAHPSESAPVEAVAMKSGGEKERERVDTTGWTTGVVKGDITIAVSVLDRITTISVMVEEMRSPIGRDNSFKHPNKYVVPVTMGKGTPTFEVKGIAFSEYPYLISLYAPGLNGSSAPRVIDQEHPIHDDIRLAITPGAPFSVLLRDQDQNPYPNVDVRLVPAGLGLGRPTHQKTTDNFGSAVFEDVLAGEYDIVTGQKGLPLAPPERINIASDGRMYGPKVQGQGHVVTVPRGMPLQISLSCGGYGVADAKIKLTASDRTKLTVLEAVSDYSGRADFPHLTPGLWQIDVLKDNFQPRTQQITIKDGELPPIQQIVLHRAR